MSLSASNRKTKVGLFFGSFNPIHVGHLVIANVMLENTDMGEVWFVVSPHNPLKERTTLLADHHRLQMVKIAIDDNYGFRACDEEFILPKPSYTVITLTHLSEKYPNKEFALIMGADNLCSFHKWRNYEYIMSNYKIYVYPRPKSGMENTELENLPSKGIEMINAPMMDISSSYIRNAIKEGKSIKYIVSEPVLRYIEEMNFYKK